ncbi:MAG: sugar transferase [Chloroflexota bacterium]|nr:MAG: sugar transferase [Chloroflexota bacterium]
MTFFPQDVPTSKRLFDITFSSMGLLLLSPLLIVIGLVIILVDGFPIFFRQMRPGYKGKPFTNYKFRTMTSERDPQGRLLSDEDRLLGVGKFLRASSLDELPELINIFKGEMSIVGPRPLLMQYLSRYTPEQARRHDVLPGMTGWAQINGRNAITWEEKFSYDVWYVDHWTFGLDMKIIAQTIWKVILREGINEPGHISAVEFMGTKQSNETDHLD